MGERWGQGEDERGSRVTAERDREREREIYVLVRTGCYVHVPRAFHVLLCGNALLSNVQIL